VGCINVRELYDDARRAQAARQLARRTAAGLSTAAARGGGGSGGGGGGVGNGGGGAGGGDEVVVCVDADAIGDVDTTEAGTAEVNDDEDEARMSRRCSSRVSSSWTTAASSMTRRQTRLRPQPRQLYPPPLRSGG